MEVTVLTWVVGTAGILLMTLLGGLRLVAVVRPRAKWTVENVYGGDPSKTDPKAFFAYNQGLAWADALFWAPVQLLGSIGMLFGMRWGFLLALIGSVPFWYTAIPIFVWDRDMGVRQPTVFYWVIVWSMFPAFGLLEGVYCFARLL